MPVKVSNEQCVSGYFRKYTYYNPLLKASSTRATEFLVGRTTRCNSALSEFGLWPCRLRVVSPWKFCLNIVGLLGLSLPSLTFPQHLHHVILGETIGYCPTVVVAAAAADVTAVLGQGFA